MEKIFYGVKLVIKTGSLTAEQADAYISDDQTIKGPNVININLCHNTYSTFENIFRKTLEALLAIDKSGGCKTIAIGMFTKNTGNLNNYQVIRAILCGMYGFCQITDTAKFLFIHKNNIREITLIIPPEALSAAQELARTENFKNFTDMYGEKPSMQQILQREYHPRC